MRQLQPETGKSLPIFQNTDPIAFVLFISLFLTYCIKEGNKSHHIRKTNANQAFNMIGKMFRLSEVRYFEIK